MIEFSTGNALGKALSRSGHVVRARLSVGMMKGSRRDDDDSERLMNRDPHAEGAGQTRATNLNGTDERDTMQA
eukprot:2147636-Rhodomonas_salina.1